MFTSFLMLLLIPLNLQAEVIVKKRVNSWTQEGYLIVVGTIISAFCLCLIFAFYEQRRKRK